MSVDTFKFPEELTVVASESKYPFNSAPISDEGGWLAEVVDLFKSQSQNGVWFLQAAYKIIDNLPDDTDFFIDKHYVNSAFFVLDENGDFLPLNAKNEWGKNVWGWFKALCHACCVEKARDTSELIGKRCRLVIVENGDYTRVSKYLPAKQKNVSSTEAIIQQAVIDAERERLIQKPAIDDVPF